MAASMKILKRLGRLFMIQKMDKVKAASTFVDITTTV
jgi:hypothetical protein